MREPAEAVVPVRRLGYGERVPGPFDVHAPQFVDGGAEPDVRRGMNDVADLLDQASVRYVVEAEALLANVAGQHLDPRPDSVP